MKRIILTGLIIVSSGFPVFASQFAWQIDPDHSNLQFKIQPLTVSNVKGAFAKAKGVALISQMRRVK
jgi:polyisoprenoid-binding protein YceI